MGKMQRDKGKRVELMCVHLLEAVYPDAMRSANQGGGAAMCDVEKTPFWIESKGGKAISVPAALRQALTDRSEAGDPRPVLLYLKWDRLPAMVAMVASEFVDECLRR